MKAMLLGLLALGSVAHAVDRVPLCGETSYSSCQGAYEGDKCTTGSPPVAGTCEPLPNHGGCHCRDTGAIAKCEAAGTCSLSNISQLLSLVQTYLHHPNFQERERAERMIYHSCATNGHCAHQWLTNILSRLGAFPSQQRRLLAGCRVRVIRDYCKLPVEFADMPANTAKPVSSTPGNGDGKPVEEGIPF